MRNDAYNERLAGKSQGTRLIESDSVVRKDRYYKVCSDAGRVHSTLPVELSEEHELSFPRPLLSVLVVSLQFL